MWRTLARYERVDRIGAAHGRLVARVDGAVLLIIDLDDGRALRRERGTRWAIGPSGIAIAHGEHVTGVALDGVTPLGARRMKANVSALALATDGRLAIGTKDQVAHVGDWARDHFTYAPPQVPHGAADVYSPCIHGIGFLADGGVLVVGATGTVHRLDKGGALVASLSWDDLAYSDEVDIHAVGHSGCLIRTDLLLTEGIGRVTPDHALVDEQWGGVDLAFPWLLIRGEAIVRFDHDGNQVARIPIDDPRAVAVGCDGDAAVIGRSDGTLAWRSPDGGDVLEELDLGLGTLRTVVVAEDRLIALDADGSLLLAARGGASGRALGAPVRPAGLTPASVLDLGPVGIASWGPAARTIGVLDESFRVHDAEDGRCLTELADGEAMDLFRAEGAWIVYFRNAIHVVDGATLTTIARARVPPDNLRYAATSGHGVILASVAGLVRVDVRRALIERIDAGAYLAEGTLRASVDNVIATARRLVVQRRSSTTWLIALPSGQRIAEFPEQDARWSASPDGALLVDANSGVIRRTSDGARVGQLDDVGDTASTVRHRRHVAWFPDGHALVRAGDGAAIFLRDGTRRRTLSERGESRVSVSPDGARFALGDEGYLAIHDGAGALVAEHRWSGLARMPHFITPSRILATTRNISSDNQVPWLLDALTGERIGLLRGLHGAPHTNSELLWRGDRIVLATWSDQQAHVYRLDDAAPLGPLAGHGGELRSLDVDASGASLLVADESGRASVWSRVDG
ncbi:hypothetical protein WME79_01325 [Sorangium sp. So ce726]|uniref:WD40 repeat domain-containing protein n=1 Tax=Sorangium sp. So ce726 TaxID=3133319 RepID=UPI003F5FF6E0